MIDIFALAITLLISMLLIVAFFLHFNRKTYGLPYKVSVVIVVIIFFLINTEYFTLYNYIIESLNKIGYM